MFILYWLGLLILTVVSLPLTPVLVLLALPFARPADKVNCLPSWLQWLNTWDDTGCNQGMYEPAVAAKMTYGWYVKTLYWLGWRNQVYGLFHALSPRLDWSRLGDTFQQWGTQGPRPQTKGPFRSGWWLGQISGPGLQVVEFAAVWAYSATKCGTFRIGWKLQPMFDLKLSGKADVDRDRPTFCLQIKPYLTIDSKS